MKGFVIAVSLGVGLSGVSGYAQTAAGQAPAPAPRPAAPAQAPAAPQAAPARPPAPPAPFPEGAKTAYVNLQLIAQLSNEGKTAAGKVTGLTQKKQTEIAEKTKALQGSQAKLQTGGSVMSDAARGQLEKDIERQQRELERLQQDAQAELNDLQQDLQAEFQRKLLPILEQLAKEKGLHFLFSGADAGLIWAEPGLDLTAEAVKRLDAASPAPRPAPAPAK
ncbi:MAG: OmpH family outer membrane protein [Vicinamibacterales bacterium]